VANTFTGGSTVNGGTLVEKVAASGGPGALTINGGAKVSYQVGAYAQANFSALNIIGGVFSVDGASQNQVNCVGKPVLMQGGILTSTNGLAGPANDSGFGNFLLNAGTLTVSGTNQSVINSTTFAIANGGSFNVGVTGAAVDLLVASVINGGSIVKSGLGTMLLTGNNTYTGTTTVSAGTLQVAGTTGSGNVTVANTATLAGTGTVKGATTIQSGGTLASGDAGIGTLAFAGALTLNAGSKTVLELSKNSSGLANDLLAVTGALALNGTLTVTNISTNTLSLGDSFDVLNAGTFSGNFSGKMLPALATYLVWDTSQLATNGIIFVASIPVITNQPQSLVVNAGRPASFTVEATGSGLLAYQWQMNGANIAGATSSAYNLASAAATNAGNYTVVITNNYGAVTSQVATLTLVNVAPTISGAPVSDGGSFSFSFSGPAGQSFQVYASTNLTLPLSSWLAVTNGVFGAGAANYSEATTNGPQNFFRVGSP
jgi:autotransporter-associated beta strand protein